MYQRHRPPGRHIYANMTSTSPATSFYISLHTNNTLSLLHLSPSSLQWQLHLYSIGRQMPKSGTAFSPQKTNLSMGLMYCYMLYVHVMGKPASHLFSSLTATCIQGTSRRAFLQEWICHLGTKPSDA